MRERDRCEGMGGWPVGVCVTVVVVGWVAGRASWDPKLPAPCRPSLSARTHMLCTMSDLGQKHVRPEQLSWPPFNTTPTEVTWGREGEGTSWRRQTLTNPAPANTHTTPFYRHTALWCRGILLPTLP